MAYHRFNAPEGEFVQIEQLIDHARAHPLYYMTDEGRTIKRRRCIPICIWGAPGTGKTAQIQAYCDKHGLELRTFHAAHSDHGSDIVGLPQYDPETGRTTYARPAWLPTEDDPPGILFFDEINRGQQGVMRALMQPLGEGKIEQNGWVLPEGWIIIAAANPGDEGNDVEVMDDAMVDRFLHYSPGWDAPAWARWALTAKMDQSAIDFALMNLEKIDTGETDLPMEIHSRLRATARSLHYAGSLCNTDELPPGMLRVIALGLLGYDAGPEFIKTYTSIERPLRFEQIVAGEPGVWASKLEHWRRVTADTTNPDSMQGLINGSTMYLIAGLVNRDPDSDTASRVGQYLALLNSKDRTEALDVINRSASGWAVHARKAADHWAKHIQRRGGNG